jgi:nicotinamide-nucleotide amidase
MTDDDLLDLAQALGRVALARGARVATAESCTGGLISAAITEVAGSSDWFECGFVTYSNAAKMRDLGVPEAMLQRFGAVSTEVAQAMAEGARRASGSGWAVAVTGIAGPAGGSADKPVGTVCFGWSGPSGSNAIRILIPGDRAAVRRESARVALQGLVDRLA